jgi:hypothetical protein
VTAAAGEIEEMKIMTALWRALRASRLRGRRGSGISENRRHQRRIGGGRRRRRRGGGVIGKSGEMAVYLNISMAALAKASAAWRKIMA